MLFAAVPDMATTGKPPHERFHFAHVHGFVRETFDLTARRAALVPHPDYPRENTTVVYAKTDAPPVALACPGLAARLAVDLKPMPPAVFLASGAWLWPMVRRNAKAVRDTFVSR